MNNFKYNNLKKNLIYHEACTQSIISLILTNLLKKLISKTFLITKEKKQL